MRKWISLSARAALALSLASGLCAQRGFSNDGDNHEKASQAAADSLFKRLGGKEAIVAVVDDFVARVGADQRINKFFAKTDLKKLKMHLVNQICEASGGPCKYTGLNMKEAHKGMGVSGADFGALVEDLVATLDKFKVGEKEKKELLSVLGPMKSDIVEKP
jgi:hemoglobin